MGAVGPGKILLSCSAGIDCWREREGTWMGVFVACGGLGVKWIGAGIVGIFFAAPDLTRALATFRMGAVLGTRGGGGAGRTGFKLGGVKETGGGDGEVGEGVGGGDGEVGEGVGGGVGEVGEGVGGGVRGPLESKSNFFGDGKLDFGVRMDIAEGIGVNCLRSPSLLRCLGDDLMRLCGTPPWVSASRLFSSFGLRFFLVVRLMWTLLFSALW